ncbi:hypothetical protein F2Q70_00002653 [Brassica cretica]|uniref:Uncharacterized protein n=1 Tax=Brassica cretica TaxID=69181 RepID=A0A8S9IXX2_BRACR|nr:hypothetical protein F2Q70_00002653 [Brassica cretica]
MALKNKGHGEVYKWDRVLRIVEKGLHKRSSTVLLRYCFQAVAYAIWHERNVRRVGEASQPATCLIAKLDKLIRNIISSLRKRSNGICMSFFLSLWDLFSGLLRPRSTLYCIITSQVGDKDSIVKIAGVGDMSLKTLLKYGFGFEHDFLPVVAAVHIG